jgi:Response regulator receiver domain
VPVQSHSMPLRDGFPPREAAVGVSAEREPINSETQRAQGALEHAGGAVAREQLREATGAFDLAECYEREIEVEIRIVEAAARTGVGADAAQANNLGQALAPFIAGQFQQLTQQRFESDGPATVHRLNVEVRHSCPAGLKRQLPAIGVPDRSGVERCPERGAGQRIARGAVEPDLALGLVHRDGDAAPVFEYIRGKEWLCGGAAMGCSFPARSTHARRGKLPCNSPGTYTSVPVAGTETLLLCEDEEHIRKLMFTTLRKNGYQVLEAETPEVAIRTVRAYHGPIDLLVTDAVMPCINGLEPAKTVQQLRP